jgi:WD40 repeat protein
VDSDVLCATYSPEGRYIATGHAAVTMKEDRWHDPEHCFIRLYDAQKGEELRKLVGHTGSIASIDFSPDGKRLVSGSGGLYLNDKHFEKPAGDNSIRVWDLESGRQLLKHDWPIALKCVRFSTDGKNLASAAGAVGQQAYVTLWRLDLKGAASATRASQSRVQAQQLHSLDKHGDWVMSVAFAPGDKILASGGADETVRLWDPTTGEQLAELSQHAHDVRAVAYNKEGTRFATASHDRTIKIWDAQKREVIQTLRGHNHYVTSVILTPDDQYAVSAADDNKLILWELIGGRPLVVGLSHSDAVSCLALSPDGKMLASGGKDYNVCLSEIRDGKLVHKYRMPGHTAEVRGLAFSPDGKTVVSGSRDGSVRFWWVDQRYRRPRLLPNIGVVYSVAISPDGKLLAVGGGDWSRGSVKVYDFATSKQVAELTGYSSLVHSLAFTADSQRLATGGGDKTVRIWRLTETPAPAAAPPVASKQELGKPTADDK